MPPPMNTSLVEIRIHLPTGEVIKKTEAKDVMTWPPLNLRAPMIAIFEGEQQPQTLALPIPIVAIMYRDPFDSSLWHRWYGARLEIVERETLIEVPKLDIPRLV